MIIVDDATTDERSPLKGPTAQNTHNDLYSPPPPPYGATSYPVPSPSPTHRGHYPVPGPPSPHGWNHRHQQQHEAHVNNRVPPQNPSRRALNRFVKAYLLAILLILSWGIVLGGIEVSFHDHPNHPGPRVREWVKDKFAVGPGRRSPSGHRQIECATIPTVSPIPGKPYLRPLPIDVHLPPRPSQSTSPLPRQERDRKGGFV